MSVEFVKSLAMQEINGILSEKELDANMLIWNKSKIIIVPTKIGAYMKCWNIESAKVGSHVPFCVLVSGDHTWGETIWLNRSKVLVLTTNYETILAVYIEVYNHDSRRIKCVIVVIAYYSNFCIIIAKSFKPFILCSIYRFVYTVLGLCSL